MDHVKKNVDGTNSSGYTVVTIDKILKSKPLAPHFSDQAAELIALTEACKLGTRKRVIVYTDSAYAFNTLHVFAQQWKNRGMIISTGKSILHTNLILTLLKAVRLPLEIAVCKCAAHTTGTDLVTQGNRKADEEAKAAAARQDYQDIYTADILKDMQQSSPEPEKQFWANKVSTLSENELWK